RADGSGSRDRTSTSGGRPRPPAGSGPSSPGSSAHFARHVAHHAMRVQVALEMGPDEVAVEGFEGFRLGPARDRAWSARERFAQEVMVQGLDDRPGGGPAGVAHEAMRRPVIPALARG